jgi:hypothetical protein
VGIKAPIKVAEYRGVWAGGSDGGTSCPVVVEIAFLLGVHALVSLARGREDRPGMYAHGVGDNGQ